VSALTRYGARMRPNASSFSLSMAPTRTGTIDISFLMGEIWVVFVTS
jgi:hypothetical protein